MQTRTRLSHYYGDFVRIIFILTAVYILWGLPQMVDALMVPLALPIIAVVVFVIAAGVTNPARVSSLILNVCASVVALVGFTYISWVLTVQNMPSEMLIANQIISVAFLVASYLSVKSLRGAIVADTRA